MKLTKKLEKEIWKVYETWLHSYINGDVKTYNYYLDKDYHFIGSTNNEEFLNRKDTTEFFKKTADQLAGKTELKNNIKIIETYGELVFITHFFDAWFLAGSDWNFYGRFRFTNVLHETKDGWRFIYQHYSTPDIKAQEGETIGYDQISAENLQLREAIRRRTKELEEKNRELKIEASLERVRAVAMGMQKSDELKEVVKTLSSEIGNLDVIFTRTFIVIYDPQSLASTWWMSNPETNEAFGVFVKYNEHLPYQAVLDAWRERKKAWLYVLEGDDKKQWDRFLFHETDLSNLPVEVKDSMQGKEKVCLSCSFSNFGYLVLESPEPISDSQYDILYRFAKVFDLTYTRFLDIQKAEAQAREAQIEAALERVRSRSMSMQKSEELKEVIRVVFDQLVQLNINVDHAGFVVDYTPKADWHFWIADKQEIPSKITHPWFDSVWANQFDEAKEKGTDFFPTYLNFEEKNKFYRDLFNYIPGMSEQSKEFYFNCPGLAASNVLMDNVALYIENFSATPYTDEENKILMRFGKVFQQTYTRFLDLQKAEAQAREAQIEAALERVRSRTIGMQRSDELQEAAMLLFQQVIGLGVPAFGCGFNIWDKDRKFATAWMAGKDRLQPPFKTSSSEDIFFRIHEAAAKGETLFVEEQGGEALKTHYEYMNSIPVFKEIADKMATAGQTFPTFQILHCAFFPQGYLMFITFEPVTYAYDIFRRFAKVFEQTYTRFLDLQKAEEQAKEASIQLSLERIRAGTMAMQKSEELREVAILIRKELRRLGLPELFESGYISMDESDRLHKGWLTDFEGKGMDYFELPLTGDWVMDERFNSWKSKNPLLKQVIGGQQLIDHIQFALPAVESSQVREQVALHFSDPTYFYHSYFEQGAICVIAKEELNSEQEILISRFSKEFRQTYTRFLDLQKAEAQAREAQIETALERLRNRTLAMQKSDELAETAAVLFQQLIHLGIEPNRLYIGIIKENSTETEFWITDEDGSKITSAYTADLKENYSFNKMYDGWKEQKKSLVIDMRGKELEDYFAHLTDKLHIPFKGGLVQKRRLQYVAYFSKGLIGMASPEEQPAETIQLLERFAGAFNLTFIRFNDLKIAEAHALKAEQDLIEIKAARKNAEKALKELQAAQKQLIQSEKMASLGELTAGIAHEIQNPLNFVNNFSDVSNELIDEMKEELEKGNKEEVLAMVGDIKQNLEKILHHGKRADGIVKGMLQHSRISSGQKEPTDINALAAEYLNLAYHGMRARDKSFNAKFETDLDASIEKINVVPQEIGRVMLNLINNAFYACAERSRSAEAERRILSEAEGSRASAGSATAVYEPTVTVITKKLEDKVEVKVKDNGNGIPDAIREKIFQPFFTTKPTGQGTGLGLSLSYDTIKAHGGEIKVESEEGEGTEFIILLPAT